MIFRVQIGQVDKRHTKYYFCHMKFFDWNLEKSEELKKERDICFEDALFSIGQGGILDILEHPNKLKYPDQRVFIVKIDDYAYIVPFIEEEEVLFIKTIIPSRKMTKNYLGDKDENKKG